MADALEKRTKITTFHVELLANFVAKPKATADGDATRMRYFRQQPAPP